MPAQFEYKAVARSGEILSGNTSATNITAVEEFLREQALLPIKITAIEEKRPVSLFGFLKRSDYDKLIMFTGALATMQKAGITLLRSLTIIRIGDDDSRFNQAIDSIRTNLQSGQPLSEAMAEHKDIFTPVYVSCISAGEESGHLDDTLTALSQMLEREADLTRQLKAGVRYPLMVIGAIAAAFVVIMQFVVPRFTSFYAAFDADLPLPTQIIINTSNFFTSYWPALLAFLIAFGFGARAFLKRRQGRLWFDRWLLRLPVLGDLIIKGNVARFSLMFRILISSGLTIVRSVDVLVGTIKNLAIATEIEALGESFRSGREIDVASEEYRFFPRQALHMLAVGLESGSLDSMLQEVGEHYTKEVIYTSRQLTAIIEPILTLVMGVFVLILALAVFLPMWNLIKVFQG